MSKIIKLQLDNIMSEKYLSYAVSTIISRSLPDIRDGLKPVHRRIIYSMYQLKLLNSSSFKKCARIVGDVMGKFHPHGDQAIYDSLVRLSQNFSTRATLIEGQGNFGNIDGDNAAAMRYTEARLDDLAKFFFDGIEEDSVNFKENYDGQNLEPEVLPTKLPNILLNGASGIAVGMATNIPPHNIFELNEAIIKLIKNPNLSLNNLLKDFLGPDLPTGGEILITSEELKQIYKKGHGSFLIRSKWNVEKLKNGLYQIVINEIPFQINKTKLIEQIANLINIKKIPLEDILDESDENIRIILKPKNRNINSSKLMELCFKLTDLSIRYSCNFNVLIEGVSPNKLGLIEILNHFIDFRTISIKRKSKYNINKINQRLEILNGYLIAFKYLDKIINIIRNKSDPRKEIIKKYKLNLNQTDAILNMRLGSLKKINEIETKNEIKSLKEQLNTLNKLLKNKTYLDNFLITEFKETNKLLKLPKYERKTIIRLDNNYNNDVDLEEFENIEKLTIIINKDNSLKTYKDHLNIDKLKKEQKDIEEAFHINSNQKLLLFASSGRVFTINPNEIPSGKSKSKNFIYFIDSNISDKLIKLLPYSENLKCLVVSLKGKGFIADLKNIISSQKKGKQLFNLKNDDSLFKVIVSNKKFLACLNSNAKLLIFDINSIPELNKGSGVQLQKIKDKERISDIQNFDIDDGLNWQIGSQIRNEKNLNFWLGKRSQTGKKVPKRFNKNLKFYD